MDFEHNTRIGRCIILMILIGLLAIPVPAAADTIVVNTVDDLDDGTCDAVHCSLREAINKANQNPGPDTISFAALDASSGNITLELLSFLNPLLDDATTIDGTTIQGYVNEPVINIVAIGVIEDGLALQSKNNVIRGLSIGGFGLSIGQDPLPTDSYGGSIVITGSGNLIEGNILGMHGFPSTVGARLAGYGNSVIGNVISGNGVGIYIQGSGQVIQGNMIGTDASGNTAIPNSMGIYDDPGSGGGHVIGGSGSGDRNIISGNQWCGVCLRSANNEVQGNYIGTNASGTAAIPNFNGISLVAAINNLIGGSSPGEGNLISGNSRGLYFTNGDCQGSLVLGNKIGSDASGTAAISNHVGVGTLGSSGVTIGGLNPGEGNLVFGNNTGFRLENEVNENDYAVIGNTITQNGTGVLRISPYPGAHGFTISRNSIFENSDLGIKIYGWEYVVPSLAPPQLISASKTSASGTTCPYCLVEVFVAEPDPSGAGEGKTYLTSVSADANGLFTASFPAVGLCQVLTATSTNSLDNTSEFAVNIKVNCIHLQPPFLYPLWVFIITVFGAFGILVRRRNPAGPRWILPGSLVLGALVGAGLIFLAGSLPNVIVDFNPDQTVPYQGQLPDCASYLDPAGFSPQDGTTLELPTDVSLEWTPTGDLPEGAIRWTVDLEDFSTFGMTQKTNETSLPLSSFGVTPVPGDNFGWMVHGEWLLSDGETWLAFCSPGEQMTFGIAAQTAEEPDEEAEEIEEPIECEPMVTALMNLTCRAGPDSAYDELGYLLQGESAAVEGQNTDGTWFWILNPDWQGHCWIWSGGVEAICIPEDLRVIAAPPLPTAEPTVPSCRRDMDRSECNDAGGVFVVGDSPYCQCPGE